MNNDTPAQKTCKDSARLLRREEATELMSKLDGWKLDNGVHKIRRTIHFKDYYHTIAFVNAVAWIAHRENHHPDLEVGYNRCLIHYSTHAIGGLSENDFICAAKIDALLKNTPTC